MNFIYYLSDGMIPFIFIIIIGYGMLNKVDIFDEFVSGAVDGLRTVVSIYCRIYKTGYRFVRFSFGIGTAYGSKDVFIFGGDRTSCRYLQRIGA